MNAIHCTTLPAPDILKNEIECLRIFAASSDEAVAINVAPSGLAGMVFHQNNGQSAIEHISTSSGRVSCLPPVFLYGPGTEPSVMTYRKGANTTMQVIFKPHALKTLLGLNASALTDAWVAPDAIAEHDLTNRLMEAPSEQERQIHFMRFLIARCKEERTRDVVVEDSLDFIHGNIGAIHLKDVLAHVHLSERQFERRFRQTVGLSPHMYIRVKRFNEAIRLIKSRQFTRLTDVAGTLNFADQSHFIRDMKAFSGMTPSSLEHQQDDIHYEQGGYSYR